MSVAIYYGCAESVTGLAFGSVYDVVDWVEQNAIK